MLVSIYYDIEWIAKEIEEESDSFYRDQKYRTIALYDYEGINSVFLKGLKDRSPRVKCECAFQLSIRQDKSGDEFLIKNAKSKSKAIKLEALKKLSYLQLEDSVEIFIDASESNNESLVMQGIASLGLNGSLLALETILKLLDTGSPQVCNEVVANIEYITGLDIPYELDFNGDADKNYFTKIKKHTENFINSNSMDSRYCKGEEISPESLFKIIDDGSEKDDVINALSTFYLRFSKYDPYAYPFLQYKNYMGISDYATKCDKNLKSCL